MLRYRQHSVTWDGIALFSSVTNMSHRCLRFCC